MGRRIIGWSAALLVLAGLAEAQTSPPAGAVQVPKTGLTRCFGSNGYEIACSDPSAAAGQDGDLRAGARWPSPRFTIGIGAEVDCVTDNLTGLMWPRNLDPSPTPMTWDAAIDYAINLSQCGHSDWKLANINELESLTHIGMSPDAAASWLAASGFGIFLPYYWSATTLDRDPSFAWYVEGGAGAVRYQVKNALFYALPVRVAPGHRSEVPRTGARHSYRWGDDVYYYQTLCDPVSLCPLRGVVWPVPRFTDNADGTVTDRLTGLMWLTDANCMRTNHPAFDQDTGGNSEGRGGAPGDGHVTWSHALNFVQGINDGFYSSCGAGHTDWRLPNRRELISLADRGRNSPALRSGHPFTHVANGYWTSSPILPPPGESQSTRSWAFDAVDGALFQDYVDHAVWPVRGGDPGFVHTISGTVSLNGAGLGGVILSLSGDTVETTTTDAYGTYQFVDLANGTYTVRPGLNGYAFTPPSATVSVDGGDVQQDFWAVVVPTYSIGGRITDAQNDPLPGVSLTLTGPVSAFVQSDANGFYRFAGVPAGAYTIAPSARGYRLDPSPALVSVAGGNTTQDFLATRLTLTPSRNLVDIGPVAVGRYAAARLWVDGNLGPHFLDVRLEDVDASEIPLLLSGTEYNAADAVSDPLAFRSVTGLSSGADGSTQVPIYFRPSTTVGQLSVARGVLTANAATDSVTNSVIVVGRSAAPGDPLLPVIAVDDAATTTVDSATQIDVLGNDQSLAGLQLFVSYGGWYPAHSGPAFFPNPAWVPGEVTFSGLPGDGVVFTPEPGFGGTGPAFVYAASELVGCAGPEPCRDESNLYFAEATVTVRGPAGGTLPGGGTVVITVPASQTLSNVAIAPSAPTPPPGVNFPFGAISYTVTLGTGETSSSATMTFTPPLDPRINLYKSDHTGAVLGLIPVCNGTSVVQNCWTRQDTATSTIIVLTLTDNGPFDLNPAAGVIEDPVLIGFEAVNRAPIADAGPDKIVLYAAGMQVQLDGSGSADLFYDPITYRWTITSAPDARAGTVLTGVRPFLAPGAPGRYVISLVVNDGLLYSAADTVVVNVADTPTQLTLGRVDINTSAGDQFDPHVDGDLASYSEAAGTQQIHYYRFSTGVDRAISNVQADGTVASDLLSDVQGGRIVFTRVGSDRNAIMLFDPAAEPSLVEVSPKAGSNRFGAAIGGQSLAYVDLGLGPGGEIVHVDLANGNAETRLTFDANIDHNVAVSPDGAVIVWERCEGTTLDNCDIHQSVRTGSAWANSAVTTTPAVNEESPDTNGTLVVYDSNRGAGSVGYDVFYRAVSGGAETQLQLPGDQLQASISGGVIAFESRATGSANSDIYLYEIATNRLFQVTATDTLNESLNDVTLLANGDVRLVWDANAEITTRSVYGATFQLADLFLSPPSVPAGVYADGVDPDTGTASTPFTFKTVYTSVSNRAPYRSYMYVCIDDACHNMALDSSAPAALHDGNYANGEQYTYSTTLAAGTHSYYFTATDNVLWARWPVGSGAFSGPVVSDLTVTFVECVPSQPHHVCSPRFVASGGTAPYTYAASELPAGVTVDPATGVLSGVFAPGTYTITVRVTDAAGDVYDWTWTFTIADLVPPAVTAPPDVTLVVSVGTLTPLAGLGVATAIDDISGVLTPVASPAGPFAPGFYSITWSATDAAGNTASAVQHVTINTPSHVFGLTTPDGSHTVDVSVPASQTITNAAFDPPSGAPPPGVIVVFGVVSYTVALAPGEVSTTTSITFRPPLSLVTALRMVLYKVNHAGVLAVIPACDGTTIIADCWMRREAADGTTIILILTDNGPFDLNPTTRVIEDPVMVAAAQNRPPTAHAGAHQTVEATSQAGSMVTISGSGTDPDGDALTFSWSGPCGSASTASATLVCPLGSHTMTLAVDDGYGGVDAASVQITVHDTRPPQIACAAPDTAWHAADVTIACSASDGGAGLASPADASFVLSTSVPAGTEAADSTTDSLEVCDRAGNCATAGPIGPIKVDRKGPAITIGAPTDGATYILNQVAVAAGFSCADGGSGMATCAGTTANGASLDTTSIGTKTFTVSATDAADNTSSVTHTYRVIFADGGMCEGAAGHAILEPVPQDGSAVFKQGRTVPAKFRVCDANGASMGTAGVVSSFKLVQVVSGTVAEEANVEVPSTTPDTAFRWDPVERQWIFNISTKSFSAGRTYYFRITLSDATLIDFRFGLR